MQYSLTYLLIFFLIYGFGGFVLESSFGSIINKKSTRREGFITNYFCPLYGLCGIVIIQIFTICEIAFTNKFTALLIATIGSILAVTFLEYITGFTLDKFFHHKMWDYSKNLFNLHSYICLEFSLIWGIVAIILSNFLHPIIEMIVMAIPETIVYFSVYLSYAILVINSSYNVRKNYHLHNIKL